MVVGNFAFGIFTGPKNLQAYQRDDSARCESRLSLIKIALGDKRQRAEGGGKEDADEEARVKIEFRITGGFFEWKLGKIRDWSWEIKWDKKRVKRREETCKTVRRNEASEDKIE